MSRPSKLTPEIQQKIVENIALGLSYSLAAEAAGVTYQSLNSWLKRGTDREIWNIQSVFQTYPKMQCRRS
jgi:hypothetical protein